MNRKFGFVKETSVFSLRNRLSIKVKQSSLVTFFKSTKTKLKWIGFSAISISTPTSLKAIQNLMKACSKKKCSINKVVD